MDATAVVSTALTIDLNNFIKGALNGLSDVGVSIELVRSNNFAPITGVTVAWSAGGISISVVEPTMTVS